MMRRCQQLHGGVRVHSVSVRKHESTTERDLQSLHQRDGHHQRRLCVRRVDDDRSTGEPKRSRNILTEWTEFEQHCTHSK